MFLCYVIIGFFSVGGIHILDEYCSNGLSFIVACSYAHYRLAESENSIRYG